MIDELEELIDAGKMHIAGKVWIDEEKFYIQTSKLKKALLEERKNNLPVRGGDISSTSYD